MSVVMEGVTASRKVLTRRAVPFLVGPGAYPDDIASSYRTCSLTLCNQIFRDLYPSAATYVLSMRNSHLAPASGMDHGGHMGKWHCSSPAVKRQGNFLERSSVHVAGRQSAVQYVTRTVLDAEHPTHGNAVCEAARG